MLVDASKFPVGDLEYDDEESIAGFPVLRRLAEEEVMLWPSSPPIKEMVLAFGIAPIVALYLVRFTRPIAWGELAGETEKWAVAGDLPTMCFETMDAPTPALALELYCCIADDWADAVLSGRDLSECYPIPNKPTEEIAKLLRGRTSYLRREMVPIAT